MGLLNSMTVKYTVDLSDLKSGTAQVKDLISSVKSIAADATAALQTMATAFNGGDLASQISSATNSITSLAEDAAVTGESLLSMGTDAEEMGSEVAAGADEASSGLSNLGARSGEASGGLGGFFQRISSGISNLFDFGAHLTTTILNMQSLGQTAISMAANLLAPAASAKEIESSLEIFDGSAAKAKAELQSLADFAANTPFSTTDIDEAALHLQGVGINARDVQPDILALGDALDAMGKISSADLQGLVDDFSKIATQGHLTTDVVNSFALRGIDAWKILEQQTGKTHDQLATMISKGLFPAKDAMKDLTEGIEKSPLYHGQMANDTKGWAGALSNLKANFDQVLVSLGSPVIDGLVPVFNDLGKQLSSQSFKDFAGSVGKGIGDVFGKIADAAKHVDFKTIGQDVQKLGDWFKTSLAPAIEQARPGFEKLATVVGNLANSALPPLLQSAGDLIPKVVTLSGDIAGGLGTAIPPVVGWFHQWGPVVLSVGIALSTLFIPAVINSGVQSVIAGTKVAYNFVASIVQSGIAGWEAAAKLAIFTGGIIATGAKAIWSGAVMAGQFVANMVKAGVEAVIAGGKIVVSFVGSLIEAGVQAGITAVAFVSDLIPSVISFATEAIAAAATAIPAVLVGFGAWIAGAAGVAIANIVAFWPIYLIILAIVAVVAIVILVITHWGDIIKWLGDQWSRFVGWVQLQIKVLTIIFTEIGRTFQSVWQTAWGWLTGIFGNVGNWFHDRFNDGINRVKSIFSDLKSFAQGIWNDIAGGVKGALNFAIDQINNLIRAINSVSGAIGIPAIPLIPHLRTGGFVEPGGFAIAGDPGPNEELIYGGKSGATVFNHSQTVAMLSAAGGGGGRGGDVHLHVHLDGEEIAHYTAEPTAEIIVRKLFGHGPVRGAA